MAGVHIMTTYISQEIIPTTGLVCLQFVFLFIAELYKCKSINANKEIQFITAQE